ncbi:MAG: FmdB family zinc ribbon protein [Parachlamydiaceae bacterium]
MPNYDYYCADCGYKEEILQKMSDVPLTLCPECHKPAFKRQFGVGIGLQFQGSGFYSTDYQHPSSSGSDKATPASASKACGCGQTSCS